MNLVQMKCFSIEFPTGFPGVLMFLAERAIKGIFGIPFSPFNALYGS